MADIKNNKETDEFKLNHGDLKPEIAKLAKKKSISIIPALTISAGLLLLLAVFLYIFFFKNIDRSDLDNLKQKMLRPEITKKEFTFKKAKPEEEKQDVEKVPAQSIIESKNVVSPKPLFKKYRSIPPKSNSTSIDENSASKEDKKEAQQNEEAAVIAEQITINPNFLISEGTYIPCSLLTRFTSDVTGRVTCAIAEDVYSANGLVKLIEKGTKAIGVYQGGNLKHGVGRMFVIWTKLITPDFKRIKLVDSQVVGQLSESGIDGWIDSHFFKRFGGAILLSTVRDIIKITQAKGSKKEKGTSININNMDESKDAFASIIEKMLENSINIPPTMYKNQGDIVGILVGRDIDFSKVYKLKVKQ
jgi:type IV secretory pathway VirB10-like protein